MKRAYFLVILLLPLCLNALAQESLSVRIASSEDDAEEFVGENPVGPAGSAYLDSSDLEMARDGSVQIVGLRFTGINLPQGAPITSAYIQFTVDEATDTETTLTLRGEASANAAAFTDTPNVLSSRPQTSASVDWSPPAWEDGQAGPEQRTPDISPLIQEIVNRPDWQAGNALAVFITGEGKRVAESFDGSESGAPTLVLSFGAQPLGETPAPAEAAEEAAPQETTESPTAEDAAPSAAESSATETTPTEPASPAAADGATATEATSVAGVLRSNQRRYPFSGQALAGSLLVTDYGSGTVILTLDVRGQAVGTVYGATLNTGSCSEQGSFLLNLEPVRSERGSLSVTPSKIDFATLTQADLSVNLYAAGDPGTPIACGEVGAQ